MSGFLIPLWINSISIAFVLQWVLSCMYNCGTPDPELQDSSSLHGLHRFSIAKTAKQCLHMLLQQGMSRVRLQRRSAKTDLGLPLPFSPIYKQAAKIAKPCKNNVKAQWELDFVAFPLWMSRRGWQTCFRCSWERSVNRPVCVLAGLLAVTPERAELVGAVALHVQSSSVNALRMHCPQCPSRALHASQAQRLNPAHYRVLSVNPGHGQHQKEPLPLLPAQMCLLPVIKKQDLVTVAFLFYL